MLSTGLKSRRQGGIFSVDLWAVTNMRIYTGGLLLLFITAGLLLLMVAASPASAGGWGSVHRYVHRTGNCGGAREVMASYYSTGHRTASGERFNPHGMTAAARDIPMGSRVSITNPHNGRTINVRINDRGPWGIAWRKGTRIDLALGAARALGMRQTSYVCVN